MSHCRLFNKSCKHNSNIQKDVSSIVTVVSNNVLFVLLWCVVCHVFCVHHARNLTWGNEHCLQLFIKVQQSTS